MTSSRSGPLPGRQQLPWPSRGWREGRDDVKTYAGEGEGVNLAVLEGFVTGVVTLSQFLPVAYCQTGEGEERSVRVVVDGGLDRRRP